MRLILLLAAALTFATATRAQRPTFPTAEWQQTSPQAAGWDLKRTKDAADYAAHIGATSVLFIQHGLIVAEGGDIAQRNELHSCRKSFLSALIGIAVAQGQIHLEDTLAQLNIDDNAPSLTPAEKQATVHDLLEARSGVYHGAAYETTGMAAKRPARGSHPHGTFWYYNNWDFNALGHIYEQATHQSIYDALATEIATPIGMQDYRPKDGKYVRESSSNFPAYTFKMSARDFARFALLFLHHGNWNGTQIVPAAWVAESTHPYSNTPSGGYGYLWWTGDSATTHNHPEDVFPAGSFWLEGHLGQYAVVVPSRDLIVVVRVAGDHPAKEIHKDQMARLVEMVVNASAK
jgi:CubicO group peptidase (beta-lactamase class C family)